MKLRLLLAPWPLHDWCGTLDSALTAARTAGEVQKMGEAMMERGAKRTGNASPEVGRHWPMRHRGRGGGGGEEEGRKQEVRGFQRELDPGQNGPPASESPRSEERRGLSSGEWGTQRADEGGNQVKDGQRNRSWARSQDSGSAFGFGGEVRRGGRKTDWASWHVRKGIRCINSIMTPRPLPPRRTLSPFLRAAGDEAMLSA